MGCRYSCWYFTYNTLKKLQCSIYTFTVAVRIGFNLVYTFIIQCSLDHQFRFENKSMVKLTPAFVAFLRPRQPLFKCTLIDGRALTVHVLHHFAFEDLSLSK